MLKIQFRDGRSDPVMLVTPGQTIGKAKVNDIVIDVNGVSGFHADLQVDGDRVTISNVDEKRETILNGEALTGPTTLRPGDIVAIEGVELEIIEDDPNANTRTLVLSGTALGAMVSGNWSLIADSGPEKGQQIPIRQLTKIGRAMECDISILEPSLSRQHAELVPDDGKLIIKDLGSANGTYLNGEKITEAQLKDDDVIQFNKIKFIVRSPI